MKSKLVLVKYGDKVLLAVLAGVLVWTVLRAARPSEEAQPKFGQDLERLGKAVQSGMTSPVQPIIVPLDVVSLGPLVASLQRPPAVEALPSGPFFRSEYAVYPTVGLMVNETKTVEVPGVQIVDVVQVPDGVDKNVVYKYDPEKGVTTLTLKATLPTGTVPVRLVLKDKDNQEHVFPIMVYTKPPVEQPLPLRSVLLIPVYGKVVITAELQQPLSLEEAGAAMPAFGGAKVARAVGFKVYRRKKGAPDTEYRALTDVVGADTLAEFGRKLSEWEALAERPAESGGPAELRPEEGGPGERRAEVKTEEKMYCAWRDTTVQSGEVYDYKLVAVSKGLGKQFYESEPAVVTFQVPPEILFYVARIREGRLNILVVRQLYDERLTLEARFNDLLPGDPIGTRVARIRALDIKWGTFKGIKDDADMYTGCALVDVVQNEPKYVLRIIEDKKLVRDPPVVRVPLSDGTWRWEPGPLRLVRERRYDIGVRTESFAMYLDKKDSLEAKYRGLPAREVAKPPTRPRLPMEEGAPGLRPRETP